MNYGDLKDLMRDAKFSPEQLGSRLGVSGMTLRRWSELPDKDEVPELYEKAVHEVVFELLAEGVLDKDSGLVQKVLKSGPSTIFNAAIKNIGLTPDFIENATADTDGLLTGMTQIGAQVSKRESVERSKPRISSFSKMGKDWKKRIGTLLEVIKSKEITSADKFAAYGALFYLLTPFDLIPDQIPFFGLVDDFLILGIVAVYYAKRFPALFGKPDQGG